MRKLRVVAALVLFVLLATAKAGAEGFQLDRYPNASTPADLLWVERADPDLNTLDPYVRAGAFYAYKPLVVAKMSDPSEQHALISSQVGVRAAVGLALHKRLIAGLVLAGSAQSSDASDAGMSKPSAVGIGSPGIDARVVLFDRTDALEAAIATTVFIPVGSSDALAADSGFRARPRLILSRSFSEKIVVTGSVGTDLHKSTTFANLEPGSEMIFALGTYVPFGDSWGGLAELGGSTVFAKAFEHDYTPVEAVGGLRFESASGLVAQAGVGTGLTHGFGTPVVRVLATLAYAPSKPAPAPVVEPAPSPAPLVDNDRDHDGVLNAADKCPDQAEDRDGFQDADGCPELDNDGDGIADATDKCPLEAEDRDGFQDADGCPDLDNDNDGVPDATDECPTLAETKNGYKDEDGCPDYVRVEAAQIRTLEPIFFDTKSDHIQTRSEGMLLELANVIKGRPDLGRISVDGHTDSRGGAAFNLQLSARRAASVMRFLIEGGAPAERLESHGFGLTKPIADNRTEAGRATNRRVEFRLIEAEASAPTPSSAPTTPQAPLAGPPKP